jgi:hypothetical protein
MEFILITVFALSVGFVCGLRYSKSYYDGSEYSGTRKWQVFQDWCSSTLLVALFRHWYLSHRLVYVQRDKQSGDTLESDVPAEYYDRMFDNKAIFAGHPHGLVALSSFLTVGLPAPPPRKAASQRLLNGPVLWQCVRPCVHRHVFAVPFVRDVALWLGAIDVSRETIERALETHSVYITPGGYREMIRDPTESIQSKHTGFLQLAYRKKRLVFPLIHSGQEAVFRSYSSAWLDQLRHVFLDQTGLPLPPFFIGPLPRPLTTYLLEPHDPSRYETEADFINDYFTLLRQYNADIEARESQGSALMNCPTTSRVRHSPSRPVVL